MDKVGSRTKLTLSNGNVITYGYDAAYQLTRELREDDQSQTLYDIAFHYDDAGNRTKQVHAEGATTTTVYYHDPGNKLTKTTAGAVTTTYTYDANGSLTKKDDGSTTSTYGYNVFGLMNTSDDGTITATYQFYGPNWARSRSVVDGATTKFYYDGDNVVAEANAAATVTATYVTAGLDQNVSMTRGGEHVPLHPRWPRFCATGAGPQRGHTEHLRLLRVWGCVWIAYRECDQCLSLHLQAL